MAAVGDHLLSAFLPVLFGELASVELLNLAGQHGLRSKLKKLERKLQDIQVLLSDAKEKQLTANKDVKAWLDRVQDLGYDVEDTLDAFATEILPRSLMAENHHQASTTGARNLISAYVKNFTPRAIIFDVSMRSKIKDLTSRLEDLCERRDELGLQMISVGTSSAAAKQGTPTTSLRSTSSFYGRDEDKAKILEMVLSAEPTESNFGVISIVGMAGMGKTTLAQEVFCDEAVYDFQFAIKAWLWISNDFDVLSISKQLLLSVTGSPCDIDSLNEVQAQLEKEIDGKKFLIVLDDVWNEDRDLWETLNSVFVAAAQGSKIIITTRNEGVAFAAGSSKSCKLSHISDNDCWQLFLEHASRASGDINDINGISDSIRMRVIKKCMGLPLVTKTLGCLLRSLKIDAWEEELNTNTWDLYGASDIFPSLMLSYYPLPSHLKRCFAYCAIFPKGYEFEEKEVGLLWIAEGIIQQSEDSKQLDLAGEYFRNLLSRSFFQQSSSNSSKYVMHDLLHYLAQILLGKTNFKSDANSKQFESSRHFSYIPDHCDGKNKFERLKNFESLRTFLPVSMNDCNQHSRSHITAMVLFDFLSNFKKLRVLSLKGYSITHLPKSIGDLIHLRYLNFSYTMIRSLPESISSLYNLQSLILRDCSHLMKLPSKMRNLTNLCYLDIRGANSLKEMPLGMKELKNLRMLSTFIVGKGIESNLKELKNLNFLQGELCISKLDNVIDGEDISDAILEDKEDLKVLVLEWGSKFDNSRDQEGETNVLSMLVPPPNLKELTIKSYGGVHFPSWMEDLSIFSKMRVLKLENCKKCETLPQLGQLSSLEDLTIKGMEKLKSVSFEGLCSQPSSSLEILRFEDLQEWNNWETARENNDIEVFPRLRELFIVRCPNLTGKLPDHLPSLERLVINKCAELVVSISKFSMLGEIEIDVCKEMVYNSRSTRLKSLKSVTLSNIQEFGNWSKAAFQEVESLRIENCDVEKPLQDMHSFNSLKELCIENCASLVLFPEADVCPKVSSLTIKNCKALESLPSYASLESLNVFRCDSLTLIGRGMLPSSLKSLRIRYCEKLQCFVDDACKNPPISRLEFLLIQSCPSLTCISSKGRLPGTLKHLKIENCPNLVSIAEMFDNSMCLREILLWNCEKLESIPDGLHNLCYLEEIYIYDCPNLISFPKAPSTHSDRPSSLQRLGLRCCPHISMVLKLSDSLRELTISDCPSIIWFPEEGLSTNLTSLKIDGDLKIYKPLIEWGLHKLTSLRRLSIVGCQDAMSFPQEEMGMELPISLTELEIRGFPKLKYLSSKGLEILTSLEKLQIHNCPNLTSFPKEGLPSSLLQLKIMDCPLLKRRCKRNKGKDWSKISYIPYVEIDREFVYDLEEEQ